MMVTDGDSVPQSFQQKQSLQEHIYPPHFQKRILSPSIIERNYSKAPDITNYGLRVLPEQSLCSNYKSLRH
jgi:hypothetical protein